MSTRRSFAIFDLDGTLVDSLPDLLRALNALLAEHGRRPLVVDEVRMMVGDGVHKLVERGFDATGAAAGTRLDELARRFVDLYEGHTIDHSRPFPGAEQALADLTAAGWTLAVCTNKPYQASVEMLEGLGLARYLKVITGGDSTPYKKPDPRHVLATLESLGATPAQAVFVGDSPNDAEAARAAGLPLVLVTFGYTRVPVTELGADVLIDSLGELSGALERLAAT
jgi:phosphoglycolate phosphatase